MNHIRINLKILSLFIAAFFLITLASAQLQVQINVKNNFNYGEQVSFDYTIISQEPIRNLVFTPYIYCENSPQPLLNNENINLDIEESYNGKYIYGVIDDNYNTGECTASISIEQPYSQDVSKNFTITSRMDMGFIVKTCADANCNTPKKVFLKGEQVYFVYETDYSSNTRDGGLIISAEMNIPKTRGSESIELIKKGQEVRGGYIVNNIGTYKLNIAASAEGYKDVKLKYQFGVIEKGFEDKIDEFQIRRSPPIEDKQGFFNKIKEFFLKFSKKSVSF